MVLGPRVPRGERVNARLWAFGYEDIAQACGMTVGSVRKACQSRNKRPPALDPSDLRALAAFVMAHQKKGSDR